MFRSRLRRYGLRALLSYKRDFGARRPYGSQAAHASSKPLPEPSAPPRIMPCMLITLLITVIVIGLIVYLVTLIPLPDPWRTIAMVLIILIAIIYLLGMLGGPGFGAINWHGCR